MAPGETKTDSLSTCWWREGNIGVGASFGMEAALDEAVALGRSACHKVELVAHVEDNFPIGAVHKSRPVITPSGF